MIQDGLSEKNMYHILTIAINFCYGWRQYYVNIWYDIPQLDEFRKN